MAKKRKKARKISGRKQTLYLSFCDWDEYELWLKKPICHKDDDGDIYLAGNKHNTLPLHNFCQIAFEQETRFKLKSGDIAKVTIEKL